MKKHHFAICLVFVLLLGVLGVTVVALDVNGNVSDFKCAYVQTSGTDENDKSTLGTDSFSGSLSGEYANYDMVLSEDYGFWNMQIVNSGDEDIQVELQGNVYRIKAHTSGCLSATSQWSEGCYQVGFSSCIPGGEMGGSVVCTLSGTQERA